MLVARIALALSIAILPLTAQSTLTVPGQHATIQGAIVAAANGDTVVVAPGTYVENIDFLGKAITVISSSGSGSTVINGGANGRVATFRNGEPASCRLSGFTLTNGRAIPNGLNLSDWGAGVYCENSSPSIDNCDIVSNHAPAAGGGICVASGSPTFHSCRVRSNSSACSAGGVWVVFPSSVVVMRNCLVASNIEGNCDTGGVNAEAGASLTLINCTVTQNVGGPIAGGVGCFTGASIVLRNTIVWGNSPPTLPNSGYGAGTGTITAINSLVEAGVQVASNSFNQNPMFQPGSAYLLSSSSPCIDAGSTAFAAGILTDLDGGPRVIGASVDIGCDEFYSFDLCATGGVGANAGGPFNVLRIGGSAGLPLRRVAVGIGQPLSIGMLQPATNPFPAPFSVFGLIGEPAIGDVVPLPFNVGSMCFVPAPLNPMLPGIFVLTNNFAPIDPFGYVGLVGSNPTPWAFVHAAGLPFPFVLTFQGVILETPGSLRVTNAVIVDVN